MAVLGGFGRGRDGKGSPRSTQGRRIRFGDKSHETMKKTRNCRAGRKPLS
jgi:hypothetical protein